MGEDHEFGQGLPATEALAPSWGDVVVYNQVLFKKSLITYKAATIRISHDCVSY